MFDFGTGEIVVLAVLALLVLGPEQIPTCARQLGKWVRQLRQIWARLSEEFDQALGSEEMPHGTSSESQNLRPERESEPPTISSPPKQ